MKITLINSQITEANNLVPPVSVIAIASVLDREGFEVQVIDDDFFNNDFSDEVVKFNPNLIGISFLTPAYSRARETIKKLKTLLPQALVCSGGFHTSLFPERILDDFSLDFCVIGEGEATILEICNKIKNQEDFCNVHGICLKKGGLTSINPQRELIEDLDSLPLPAMHLLNFTKYLRPPGLFRGRAMSHVTVLATSRGCPYSCAYCGGRRLYDGKVRLRSVQSIKKELDALIKIYKVKGVWIIDECYTIDRNRAKHIADLIDGYGIAWGIQTRVDLIDYELIDYFKKRGCIEINFGVESGVDRILGILKKGTTTQAAVETFGFCKKIGMRTTANFMLGSPTETEEDMYQTFKFSKRIKASFTTFHITTPFPGTELYDQAIRTGLLAEPISFDEAWMHRGTSGPVMRSEIPPDKLMKLRSQFQNHFFIRNYLNIQNIRYGLFYLLAIVRYPRVALQSYKAYRKHGRIDSFIENIVAMGNRLR